jgi:hypothetical protein
MRKWAVSSYDKFGQVVGNVNEIIVLRRFSLKEIGQQAGHGTQRQRSQSYDAQAAIQSGLRS